MFISQLLSAFGNDLKHLQTILVGLYAIWTFIGSKSFSYFNVLISQSKPLKLSGNLQYPSF